MTAKKRQERYEITSLSDTARRFIVIMVAVLVAYFFLFNVQVEVGGICAGIAVRLLADFVIGSGKLETDSRTTASDAST